MSEKVMTLKAEKKDVGGINASRQQFLAVNKKVFSQWHSCY
jgi:hypothetical protein